MKKNKVGSLVYIVLATIGFFLVKDMFLSNVLNFTSISYKVKEYEFNKDNDGAQILYSYFNEYENKVFKIKHLFKYEGVYNKLSKQSEIYIKYNKYYPEEPQIVGEPYFVKLIISGFGILICVIVFIISIKELLKK